MSQDKAYYYVAIHNADRSALIAGPYEQEADAMSAKDKAWARACEQDPWCWFYAVSLGRSDKEMPTRFGKLV